MAHCVPSNMCTFAPLTIYTKIDFCLGGCSNLNFGLDSRSGMSQIPLDLGFHLGVETLGLSQNLPEKIEFEETYSTVA